MLHECRESLIKPQVVPPNHRDQISEPLSQGHERDKDRKKERERVRRKSMIRQVTHLMRDLM